MSGSCEPNCGEIHLISGEATAIFLQVAIKTNSDKIQLWWITFSFFLIKILLSYNTITAPLLISGLWHRLYVNFKGKCENLMSSATSCSLHFPRRGLNILWLARGRKLFETPFSWSVLKARRVFKKCFLFGWVGHFHNVTADFTETHFSFFRFLFPPTSAYFSFKKKLAYLKRDDGDWCRCYSWMATKGSLRGLFSLRSTPRCLGGHDVDGCIATVASTSYIGLEFCKAAGALRVNVHLFRRRSGT